MLDRAFTAIMQHYVRSVTITLKAKFKVMLKYRLHISAFTPG